jgi:hypothetical protein
MSHPTSQCHSAGLPEWFVAYDQALRDAYGCVRNVDLEVRDALDIDRLDPRLRIELETVLDALSTLKGSLAVLEMTASQVLKETPRDDTGEFSVYACDSPVPA